MIKILTVPDSFIVSGFNRLSSLPVIWLQICSLAGFARVQLSEYTGRGTFKKPLYCSLNVYCSCQITMNNSWEATLPGWRLCEEHTAHFPPSTRSLTYPHFHLACPLFFLTASVCIWLRSINDPTYSEHRLSWLLSLSPFFCLTLSLSLSPSHWINTPLRTKNENTKPALLLCPKQFPV
jgi:hypothetical protein